MTSILSQDEIQDLDQKIMSLYESSTNAAETEEEANKARYL